MFPSKKQEPRNNKKKQNKQDQISDATYISDVVFEKEIVQGPQNQCSQVKNNNLENLV